jgi:hypothetical protein
MKKGRLKTLNQDFQTTFFIRRGKCLPNLTKATAETYIPP